MITPEDILNLNFYKKEKFTGSYKGMRYLIQKEHDEESDTDVFRAIYWPGPYNFATTDDSLKTSATFPFTEDGKIKVVEWLNTSWEKSKDHFQTLLL
ncbi:GNAT family acetyltransferase [Roseburia sp. OF03-24]|jgi:hypothetical protein|uniref:GNAT family acetyltransferase n=1 Tax=Roseburia TaxID=841 RepID=UPI000E4B93DB|nr:MULTISPECIES: GNAT family acetyltransferase [Roseburia]RGX92577.1 GNAT family acetyltransferase [Roseburia sp. OF03-24]RHF93679.1 GNAT family acetyltransferase [Roseburia sp. AM23-20]UMZ00957.1 GNAT family acetyltransferase [Roseburia rectibacter]